MFCVWYAFAYHTYVCESFREIYIERVELLFGAHLCESLVIEGMCDMLCVVRICASSHVCDKRE